VQAAGAERLRGLGAARAIGKPFDPMEPAAIVGG
jgi:hypothetical protein